MKRSDFLMVAMQFFSIAGMVISGVADNVDDTVVLSIAAIVCIVVAVMLAIMLVGAMQEEKK